MRTLALLLLSCLAPAVVAAEPEEASHPGFYAIEMKVLTPKGNVWRDYDALYHQGTLQPYDTPARLSFESDGQCPEDHVTCPWRGTLTDVDLAFFVDGQDEHGNPLGHFRIGVVNMPPRSIPMTREITGVMSVGQAHAELDPDGRLPGYLFELTFRHVPVPSSNP